MNSSLNESHYWSHNLSPFLWEFPGDLANWGPGGIRWYGISYLLGFISAYFLLAIYHRQNKSPYDREQIMNLITFQVIGVLIGGRVGYLLLYQGSKFLEDPLSLIRYGKVVPAMEVSAFLLQPFGMLKVGTIG